MLREVKAVIGATAVGGVLSLVAVPMGVQETGQMQAVPAEGLEPGDSFVVSNLEGSECDGEVTGDTGGIRPGQWVATMEPDGDWSVTIEIPENGPPAPNGDPTPFPPGEYEIHAFCEFTLVENAGFAAPAQVPGFNYDPITVTIVAAQPTPSTSTPTTAPPAAAPAVVAAPTYTG